MRALTSGVVVALLLGATPVAAQQRQPVRPVPDAARHVFDTPTAPPAAPTVLVPWDGRPLTPEVIVERPGEMPRIAGLSVFAAGYLTMLGVGVATIYTRWTTGSRDERPFLFLIGVGSLIPIVAPFGAGVAMLQANAVAMAALCFTAGTAQAAGLILYAASSALPDRFMRIPASAAPSNGGVSWHVFPGAPGAPLGASLAVEWPG